MLDKHMNKINPFGVHQFKKGYFLPEVMAKL